MSSLWPNKRTSVCLPSSCSFFVFKQFSPKLKVGKFITIFSDTLKPALMVGNYIHQYTLFNCLMDMKLDSSINLLLTVQDRTVFCDLQSTIDYLFSCLLYEYVESLTLQNSSVECQYVFLIVQLFMCFHLMYILFCM